MSEALEVTRTVRVPVDEVALSFVRGGGPGGQNVNKVATKAVLRWTPADSPSLPGPIRDRFLRRHAARLTNDGELVLHCDEHRTQLRNRTAVLARLRSMLQGVARPPKTRRKTKPTRGSQRRRVEAKKRRGAVKKLRQKPGRDA